jgi:uncharacterized protein with FMN-binding domain
MTVRRITLWLLSTVAVLVLAFSYRTSTTGSGGGGTAAAAPAAPEPAATPDPTTATRSPGSRDRSGSSPSQDGSTSSGSRTYQGSTVQTRWGPIEVTITVSKGRITAVTVPIRPNGTFRDAQINAYALPALRQATLDAQSADIDSVSGATVTSDGYRESLQSAVDAAHLG